MTLNFNDWEKVNIHSGVILRIENFPRAHKSAYKIWVDFGKELGIKKTSAQITINYSKEELLGKIVLGVVNLPPKNIAGFNSEFLLLGVRDERGNIALLTTDRKVPNGEKVC